MAIWAIKGYDEFYGGLHGMKEYEIFEGTEEEADARGLEMSYEVINGYTDIIDVLEEDVKDQCEWENIDYEECGEEVDDIRDEVYGEDTAWDIHQLNENKLPILDFNKLEDMFYNNPDEFLEEYAIH